MNNYNYNKLTPFKWFILENFPLIDEDFDALTNWQLFCKLGKEINKIINSENDLGTQMESVTDAFINLQNYVDNYFANLDVQDEIDNKLDEMVEAGTLQEIIADYLNSKAVFGFDSVADMVSSTNLIDGSYAKTLGYYSKNDGGAALYKIREITNDDVIDNGSIIPLNRDNLIAELVIENGVINVNQFGAKGDNTTNDSTAIQNAINYAESTGLKSIKLINYRYYCLTGLVITASEFKIYSSPLTEYANGIRFDTTVSVGIDVKNYGFKMENVCLLTTQGTNTVIGLRLQRPIGGGTSQEISDAMNIDADIYNCSFLWLNTAIQFKGRNVNIDTCEFGECENGVDFGILANGYPHRGIWIRNSRFHNIGSYQREISYDRGIAIKFPEVWNRTDVFGNIIKNNYFDFCNNVFTGCILGCTISENNIQECLHNAIVAINPNSGIINSYYECAVLIENNNISLRGNDANIGIYLKGVGRPRINGNAITNTPTICLHLKDCGNLWIANNIFFSGRSDITENVKIEGNSGDEIFMIGNMLTSFQNASNTFVNVSGVTKFYTGGNVNTGSGTAIVSNVTPLKQGEDVHFW